MVSIKDTLEFEIKSMFDSQGFKEFFAGLKGISTVAKDLGAKEFGNLGNKVDSAVGSINENMEGFKQGVEEVAETNSKGTKKIADDTDKMKSKYNFAFLSLMFIGQQFVRTFQTIITKTVALYTQFTQNTSEASQMVTALGANMTLLQFSIGEALSIALMPLVPALINIITSFADWIEQNPELFAGILSFAAALAFAMVLVGTFYLLIMSLNGVLGEFGLALTGTKGLLATVSAAGFGPVIAIVFLVILAIALLTAAWKTNFVGIKEVTKEVFGALMLIFGTLITDGIAIFKNFFALVTAIFEGDGDKILFFLTKLVLGIVGALIKLVISLIALGGKIFLFFIDIFNNFGILLLQGVFALGGRLASLWVKVLETAFIKPALWAVNKILGLFGKDAIKIDLSNIIKFPTKIGDFVAGKLEGAKDIKLNKLIDLDQLGVINDAIDANIAYKDVVLETQDAISEATPKVNDLTESYGGKDGLTPAIEDVTSSLAGDGGLSSALFSLADITMNSAIPSNEDLISSNDKLASSYNKVAKAAKRAQDALKKSKSSKGSDSDYDEYTNQTSGG